MYLQHTTTLHGVVLEQHLREHPIVTFLIVVGTLIDHSSVAGADHKVIGDIHAVIAQLRLQNLIQFNEIDTQAIFVVGTLLGEVLVRQVRADRGFT